MEASVPIPCWSISSINSLSCSKFTRKNNKYLVEEKKIPGNEKYLEVVWGLGVLGGGVRVLDGHPAALEVLVQSLSCIGAMVKL